MNILLLQARTPSDPILAHELACFARASRLPQHAFTCLNMVERPLDPALLPDHDCVMVGGSGDYSVVTGGFAWHEPMLDFMRLIASRAQPMFASCFGFQALVQALGGTLQKDPERAELGTTPITLTPQGREDALFGSLPETFLAQLGHNDSATSLPDALIPLACSERCAFQAVRLGDAPVVATQFHPELTDQDNITRYLRYLRAYKAEELTDAQAKQVAKDLHAPSPHANALIARFIASL